MLPDYSLILSPQSSSLTLSMMSWFRFKVMAQKKVKLFSSSRNFKQKPRHYTSETTSTVNHALTQFA